MKLNFLTAILMTLAAFAWLASALLVSTAGGATLSSWLPVLGFAALSVFYWYAFFQKKNAQISIQNAEEG